MEIQQAIVQIGLNWNCEYFTLFNGNDSSEILSGTPIYFQEFEGEIFTHLFGVDMNPDSVKICQETYIGKNIHFLKNLVYRADNEIIYHNNFQIGGENSTVGSKSISLKTLLERKIKKRVGLLAMDVEGAELEIFKGYDWSQKPKFLIVEVHSQDEILELKNLITAQGYRLVEVTRTGSQLQMGFLYLESIEFDPNETDPQTVVELQNKITTTWGALKSGF